jgi:hypothetical protein
MGTNARTVIVSGAAVAVALVLLAACGGGDDVQDASPSGIVVVVATPSTPKTPVPRKSATPTVTPSPTPLQVCGANPDPASPKILQVQEPAPQQQVRVPFHVRGWGSNIGVDNQGVALAVVDAKQTVQQVLDLPPEPRQFRVPPPGLEITDNTRPFAADVVINGITAPTAYCLWVYQATTAGGSPRGVVQVPVLVVP